MTTAARPTFEPARGGKGKGESGDLSAMSKQYSSRDMPSHTRLKYRQKGQSSSAELLFRDFRKDLEEGERTGSERDRSSRTAITSREPQSSSSSSAKKPRLDQVSLANLDADDAIDDDDEDEESEDEDDAAELLLELQKIREDRAAEKSKLEKERKVEEERIRTENILKGNPLMQATEKADFKVKRRWDDDVVFKNCARPDDRNKKGFINDMLRSDFHKRFMEKYIK